MASLVLPDSNFYIRSTRTRLDPFHELARHADEWEFITCGMVVVEVTRGVRDPQMLQRFRASFALMSYLNTTAGIWDRTAHLTWALDRQGVVLPASDVIIAACALEADAAVLTFDTHFQQIPGLRVLTRLS